MIDAELDDLRTHGWFVRETFAPAAAAAVEVAGRLAAFVPASVSRARHADATIRTDRRLWVEPADVPLAPLVAAFEALRVELNADAWLGLVRFDLQLGFYAGDGGHYSRHRDAFVGEDNRRVTAVAWLNPAWVPAHGGELLLHVAPEVRLSPSLGRVVVFLSEQVEHEVLPTWAPRFAATAWYYAR